MTEELGGFKRWDLSCAFKNGFHQEKEEKIWRVRGVRQVKARGETGYGTT